MLVYIRPLVLEDAKASYKWRNDPSIWRYTGSKPKGEIKYEVELEWLSNVLLRKDEKRFAICLAENDEYIGNVQLTGITDENAEFHIFIGNKQYWGQGIAQLATRLVLKYAKEILHLQEVYLYVKQKNVAAKMAYKKVGFIEDSVDDHKMSIRL